MSISGGRTVDLDPVAAATAADPYPYYDRLVSERPFHHDDRLGMWIAASANAVEDVLSSALMRVRPSSEPVPNGLVGTRVGEVFARMVRMTDGPHHAAGKRSVTAALDAVDMHALSTTADRCARLLARRAAFGDPEVLTAYMFGIAPFVVATTLGLAEPDALRVAGATADVARSIASSGVQDQVDRGVRATEIIDGALCPLVTERDGRPTPSEGGALLAEFLGDGRRRGIEDGFIVANAIGFLFQSYDATAGLIGNTLVTLARESDALRSACREDARLLANVVEEVARYDAPVQNTRRFAAADTTVMGCGVGRGVAVLVLPAAANRDPSVNPEPHRFDPAREFRRTYTFGTGAHACPGLRFAVTIAGAAVSQVLDAGIDLRRLAAPRYRPSPNTRVPDFIGT